MHKAGLQLFKFTCSRFEGEAPDLSHKQAGIRKLVTCGLALAPASQFPSDP
jgi:hypothetical protein